MYSLRYSSAISRQISKVTLASRTSPSLSFSVHTSSTLRYAVKTKGQAPDSSRQPKENTIGDQNPHLKHAVSSKGGKEGRSTGKGNAAPDPELPSHQLEKKRKEEGKSGKEKPKGRGLHTSAILQYSVNSAGGNSKKADSSSHSADSYFKDVDESPPVSSKTHTVDSTSDAAHRPNERYSRPENEYATMSKEDPYEPPSNVKGTDGKSEGKEEKLRYGGTKRDAERDISPGSEGPEGENAEGRKPER